jgi:hypothetical protein
VLLVGGNVGDGNLVRAPEALEVVTADISRRGPALGTAKDDHGPAGAERLAGGPRLFLVRSDLLDASLKRRCHGLVHAGEVGTFDKVRLPAVADEERLELLVRDAGEDGGVIDLVPVGVSLWRKSQVDGLTR